MSTKNKNKAKTDQLTEIDAVLCVEQRHVPKVDTTSNDIPCRENWTKGSAITTSFEAVAVVSMISPGQWFPTYES
jgi:hypothetical protein